MDLELSSDAERFAEKAQQLEAFSGINLRHVRGEVAEALTAFGRLGLLEEYTKHDITHVDAMLSMYDWIVPESTKDEMTAADWLLVTLATYFHDFGLLVTRTEFDSRDKLPEYLSYRHRILENDDPSVKDYRSQVEQMPEVKAEEFLYQEFVRTNHAQRIRGWLQEPTDATWGADERLASRLRSILGPIEETFKEDLGIVCESHHLDDLNDLRKYPLSRPYGRTHAEEANVQYAAILIRTADLLHITKDRVPSMAALVINPRNAKSQTEWAKQSAVRSVRIKTPARVPDSPEPPPILDTIEVHATFKEAEGFFGLTAYLQYAAKQLAQSFAWSEENQKAGTSTYLFPWRRIDTTRVEAKGFVAEPFEFTIDQGKILNLLTGHTLYNDTGVVVRELVQNALDAVRLYAHLNPATQYTPKIEVSWDSKSRILTVSDNGTGMTQDVIVQNFLRVGSSRYQEPDFRKENPEFASISRFGIGVLSTFMVADDVSVCTNHESERQARQLTLRDVHGQYLVRLVDKHSDEVQDQIRQHGTVVKLKLRPSAHLSDVPELLRHWVVFPMCEVVLTVDEGESERIGFDNVADALKKELVAGKIARSVDGELRTRFGAPIQVRTKRFEGLEIAYAVSWSRWLEEWGFVVFDPNRDEIEGAQPANFGTCIGGIRVTTDPPGYKSGGLVAMANAYGRGAPRTNVARSAIEKTGEYEQLLSQIYAAYVDHISDEMKELDSRAASLTRGAQEASYLAHEIARFDAELGHLRDIELRNIPAMIIEQDGVREAKSFRQLEAYDALSSIESTTINSFEMVLRSVRGAGGASLRNLMNALASDEVLPDVPLISGLTRTGLLTEMFTSEWEVVRLETDIDARTLTARWKRRGATPLWHAAGKSNVLPSSVATRMEREEAYGRSAQDLSEILIPLTEDIEAVGFDQQLVSCQGRILVLPGHPLLEVEATSTDVPDAARLWCIAWFIHNTSDIQRRGAGRYYRPIEVEGPIKARWLDSLVETARNLGLLEIVDEESIKAALDCLDPEVLDVQKWDQRQIRN